MRLIPISQYDEIYFKNKEDLLNQIFKKNLLEMIDDIIQRLNRNEITEIHNFDTEMGYISEMVVSFFKDRISLLKLIILAREFNVPDIDGSRDQFIGFFVDRYKPYLLSVGFTDSELDVYIKVKFLSLLSVVAFVLIKYPKKINEYVKMLHISIRSGDDRD